MLRGPEAGGSRLLGQGSGRPLTREQIPLPVSMRERRSARPQNWKAPVPPSVLFGEINSSHKCKHCVSTAAHQNRARSICEGGSPPSTSPPRRPLLGPPASLPGSAVPPLPLPRVLVKLCGAGLGTPGQPRVRAPSPSTRTASGGGSCCRPACLCGPFSHRGRLHSSQLLIPHAACLLRAGPCAQCWEAAEKKTDQVPPSEPTSAAGGGQGGTADRRRLPDPDLILEAEALPFRGP